jgi:pyruvate/2-oxoglutarate dehydrogenase complex dihydrolipoamide dehydrogenase (E3) component
MIRVKPREENEMPQPEPDRSWDVIVLGGGPAGENAAQYAIQGSDRTAVMVEAELVGGECSYWACMPSKTLLRPVDLRNSTVDVAGAAQTPPQIDVPATLRRRDSFVHDRKDDSQVKWATDNNIDVVRGHGRLIGERLIEVTTAEGETQVLGARQAVVLATGSVAPVPPVTGLREAKPWSSRDATNLQEVPRRVAIVGGGVVACESATWLRGLGAEEVTIIERSPHLLAGREPFAGQILEEQLKAAGITVLLGTEVESVSRPDAVYNGIGVIHGGPATITAGGHSFEVDELVVATGRRPATADIGLDAVGVTRGDHGEAVTDEHLGVIGAEQWLYAVGDVNGRALLTHMGKYQARIAGAVIGARAEGRSLDGPRYVDTADGDAVPGVIFTDPQVAYVGLTEAAARDRGFDVQALEYDLGSVAGAAVLRDDYVGRVKLVVDRKTDVLLGATFVGAETAELLHSATIAIVGKVPLETLWHAVPSYPTASEVWLRLLESRPDPALS